MGGRILSGDRHQIYNRLFIFPFSLAHVQNNRLVSISVISIFPRFEIQNIYIPYILKHKSLYQQKFDTWN